MYDVGDKLLNIIKRMYVDRSACVRVKGGDNEWFRVDSRVRQGCIMSPWLLMKEMKMGMGRRGVRFLEDGRD